MNSVDCFWMEPTSQVEVSLRRYRGTHLSHDCPSSGMGYHNASQVCARGPAHMFPDYYGDWRDHSDASWPQRCSCGYVFAETDEWQANPDRMYRRVDTGQLFTQASAPAGAMMHMWMQESRPELFRRGGDGVILGVKLPNGVWWTVDGPASKDGAIVPGSWTRTGIVPLVTATPSIDVGGYHGWLQNGKLKRC